MQRVDAIGHGASTPLSGADAIEIARTGRPAALRSEAGRAPGPYPVGARVTVAPTDTGIDPVAGELVAEYPNEWVLARDDPRAGRVHVHFPRAGYQISDS